MKITFKWIGGATWILRLNDLKNACDPVQSINYKIKDFKITVEAMPAIHNMGAAKKGSWMMTLTLSAKMLEKIIKIVKPGQSIEINLK